MKNINDHEVMSLFQLAITPTGKWSSLLTIYGPERWRRFIDYHSIMFPKMAQTV